MPDFLYRQPFVTSVLFRITVQLLNLDRLVQLVPRLGAIVILLRLQQLVDGVQIGVHCFLHVSNELLLNSFFLKPGSNIPTTLLLDCWNDWFPDQPFHLPSDSSSFGRDFLSQAPTRSFQHSNKSFKGFLGRGERSEPVCNMSFPKFAHRLASLAPSKSSMFEKLLVGMLERLVPAPAVSLAQ